MKWKKAFSLGIIVLCLLMLYGCYSKVETIESSTLTPTASTIDYSDPAAVFCKDGDCELQERLSAEFNEPCCCTIPSETPALATENKAVEAAKIKLAKQLQVEIGSISVFSLEKITWPDTCLGIQAPGENCSTVETPGFRVVFTVGNACYTYRTDLSGENIR